MDNTHWILELKEKVPKFLEELRGNKIPGFFHYSLTGDLYKESIKWGLGNTVFAVKVYYTLGLLDELPKKDKACIMDFIKSFQKEDGTIYDPLVRRKSFVMNFLLRSKELDFSNIFGKQTIVAETRQSISALKLLEEKPDIAYRKFPKQREEIEEYLAKLNWQRPWGAGSHFSHLVFFLKNSNLENKEELIDSAIDWVNGLQNLKDGSWYQGNPNLQQRINGAMKIITGLKVTDKMNFHYSKKLIDLCLSAKNDSHACDNFNIVYVLHYASQKAVNNYRIDEIKKFAINRLAVYRSYYFPENGGFSFLPHRANVYYYGAKISKGFNEPDIHGTVMFLWGISIIAQILGIDKELEFREQIP